MWIVGGLKFCFVAGDIEDAADDLADIWQAGDLIDHGGKFGAEGVEKLIELDDRILAACAEQVDFAEAGVEKRLPEADLIVLAVQRDERLRAIADAALGGVDDAAEVDGVIGVFQNAQVSDDVTDFFAFVELRAADYFIGDAGAHEDIL